jgi:hypothetical protein
MLYLSCRRGWRTGAVACFALLFVAGMQVLHVRVAAAQSAGTLSVIESDLAAAGFTKPTSQPASGSRFTESNMTYFRAKESVAASHPEWQKDGVADVVAVTILPTPWLNGTAPSQTNITNNYSGRISVCSFRTGYYLCVIGPDQRKDEALLNILKTK